MTLFEKLMAGELPCHVVYQNKDVFAFLDIEPLAPGHTLLVPREPAATLDALSDDAAAALGRVMPRLCRAVMQASGATAYNVLQNNGAQAHQAVPHVHFHIVPKMDDGRGLRGQLRGRPLDAARAPALARAIAAAMAQDAGAASKTKS